MGKCQESGTCVHFNGVQHDICKAGVAYSTFPGQGIPCMQDFAKDHVCELRRFPTPEEIAQKAAAREAARQRFELAFGVVKKDMKAKGLRKGKGGGGQVECPACKGVLAYSVAGCNGHVHGRCSTDGCVWWMQ